MFHKMKILIIFYGVFAVTQLIKAEVTYSYTLPRDELLPVMRKLDKFADCNKNATITNDYEFVFTIDRPTSTCGSDSILQEESFTNFIENAITKPIYFLTTNQGKTNYPTCVDSTNKKTTTLKSTNPQTVNTKIINPQTINPESTNPQTIDPKSTNPQTINTKIINPQTINLKSTNPKKTINEKNPPLKKLIDYPPNPVDIPSTAPPEKITTLNPIQEKLMTTPKSTNPQTVNPKIINPQTINPESTNPQTINPKITNPQTINTKIINPQTVNPTMTNPTKTINEKNPPLKKPIDYPPNPVGITSTAPPEKITTLNPIQEQLMKEKKERNNYLATIITAVLVGLMVSGVVGCAIAQYAKTVRQSGAYVVDNP